MVNQIILNELSLDDLVSSIREVVRDELETTRRKTISDRGNLTRQEVADLCKVSLTTVHQWTKEGRLIAYKLGGRVLYKASEVMESLENNRLNKWDHGA